MYVVSTINVIWDGLGGNLNSSFVCCTAALVSVYEMESGTSPNQSQRPHIFLEICVEGDYLKAVFQKIFLMPDLFMQNFVLRFWILF